ncbi:unnamed protein product [Schistosoma turkestanicum]|nr:unnamed protein product [Schistosoma turkestanicum]
MQTYPGNLLTKVGKRSERYTHKELRFLLEEVQKYPNIIESPNSHSETKHRKFVLWQHISKKLQGAFPDSSPKSAVQLRNWWKRTKSRAKQRLSSGSFTAEKCKLTENNPTEVQENSRGYLEAIFSEICEFRRQIVASYTTEKEDSEFTKFLEEACEDYSAEDEEVVCESSNSSFLDNSQSTESTRVLLNENTSSFGCNCSIDLREGCQIQNLNPRDICKYNGIPSQNMFTYDPGKITPDTYNTDESMIKEDNTSILFNHIITNVAANFFSNYKHVIENSSLCKMGDAYCSESGTSYKNASESSGDVLTTGSNFDGNSFSYFTDASKSFGMSTNEKSMFYIPTVLNPDSSSTQNVSKSSRKVNDSPDCSLIWLELMQIDNEILKLKKRKLDLEITISDDCLNNYYKNYMYRKCKT